MGHTGYVRWRTEHAAFGLHLAPSQRSGAAEALPSGGPHSGAGPPAYGIVARVVIALCALFCVATRLQTIGILLPGSLMLLNPPFIK